MATGVIIMRFTEYPPSARLAPYVKCYAITESPAENTYKVFPSPGLVIGIQYSGGLRTMAGQVPTPLSAAGVTGIADTYQVFSSVPETGTVLVYFTETGFAQMTSHPVNELFNLNLSLYDIFEREGIDVVREKLEQAATDMQRIRIVERYLLTRLRGVATDKLVVEAVRLMYASKGTIRISDLNKKLFVSQSPLEKRFRQLVGTTPKKFASLVRFHAVLGQMNTTATLTGIAYANGYFDQAHFIQDFKKFTGINPEQFRRSL